MFQPFSFLLNSVSLLCIFIVLVIANHRGEINPSSLFVLPLEIITLSLLLLSGRAGLWSRWLMASLLAIGVIFICADAATFTVFARPFNPIFDFYLLINGMNLLTGVFGGASALFVALLLLFVLFAIVTCAFLMLGRVQVLLRNKPAISGWCFAIVIIVWMILFYSQRQLSSSRFYQHLVSHSQEVFLTVKDQQLFQQQLDNDGAQKYREENLLARLRGKDVLDIFVESYGRTVIDKPEFSAHIVPLLERSSQQLIDQGFAARSSYLKSPTVGGLSWLAHGTAMSGLWVDNQIRYNNLMLSKRPTLNRLFQNAGWRTLAVMPAITMAWPEGNYYGYDKIYDVHNLGYQGLPFNWVTMPDQYTLSAFQRFEREEKSRVPVMAEIALISSHAPWTPVPYVIDWAAIGNGEIFNAQAQSGDSPENVWKNNERIRSQYRLSIEYALENIVSYITHYGDENLVVLVLGDHQPAPIVTGNIEGDKNGNVGSRDVPVHLIARDPDVLNAIAHWQWAEGLIPAANAPVLPMDKLRDQFVEAFSLPN